MLIELFSKAATREEKHVLIISLFIAGFLWKDWKRL